MHGFALNVATDLSHFSHINPCGLESEVMTSLAEQLGAPPDLEEVSVEVAQQFACEFDCQLVPLPLEREGGVFSGDGSEVPTASVDRM